MKKIFLLSFLLTFSLLTVHIAHAQWNGNPLNNTPVCVAANDEISPHMISDGNNGAFITWQDGRSGAGYQQYIQRINASGLAQWAANGVILCSGGTNQFHADITTDGAGGAIIVFEDGRSGLNDIYAQRIDAAGNILWGTDGAIVCDAGGFQYYPQVISDGAGGAFVTWYDTRGSNTKVYVQRISAAGTALWTTNGVAVSSLNRQQEYPKIINDGYGGVIVSWRARTGPGVQVAITAQHLDANGILLWSTLGNTVCTNASDPVAAPQMVTNGAGGAIICWQDYRSAPDHVYIQNMGSGGVPLWVPDGIQLCSNNGGQTNPALVADRSGGAIITWNDGRSGNGEVYAQHINSAGNVLWNAAGIDVCQLVNNQYFSPQIVSDNNDGALICWHDFRGADANIYAQHVDGSGNALWTPNGTAVTLAPAGQTSPAAIFNSDGSSFFAWNDFRNGNADIYASALSSLGVLSYSSVDLFAEKEKNDILLKWVVQNETNTDHYELQKSSDGIHFKNIGKIMALAGNAPEKKYSFTDLQELFPVNYYRLRIIDHSGADSYSKIIRVNTGAAVFHVYPNPADKEIFTEREGVEGKKLFFTLTDMQGRVILRSGSTLNTPARLIVSSVPAGIYHLTVSGEEKNYSSTVIIQHSF